VAHTNRGNLLSETEQVADAKSAYDLACSLLRQLTVDHPNVPKFRHELANSYNSLAAILADTESFPDAEKAWGDASELLRTLIDQDHSIPVYRADLGMILGNMGGALLQQKKLDQACNCLREGIPLLEAALVSIPERSEYRSSLRGQYCDLADALLQLGNHKDAAAEAERLVEISGRSSEFTFRAACLLVRAMGVVEHDATLRKDNRANLVLQYQNLAVTHLRGAAQQGFRDLELLEEERGNLAPTLEQSDRLRDAFRELEAKAKAVGSAENP
jgi:tetratricopeptide (TPR) repeat protein